MIRTLCLCVLTASAVGAQSTPAQKSLASLEQTARQKAADWNRLAQALEPSISRLLPCDPKATSAINEVSRASDARLAALSDYLQAAAQLPARDTEAAKSALVSGQTLESDLAAERNQVAQEQAGVEGQLANLAESAKNNASLGAAQSALQQIDSEERRRADLLQTGAGGQDSLVPSLRDLVAAAEAREVAWKNVQVAYEAERARWNAYYAARLARAQTECSITRGVAPAPARRQSKGKH